MRISYPLCIITTLFLSVYTNAQNGVSINTTGSTPNTSSILDLSDNGSRGFILPNVALTATNTAGPVTSPATGLLVWNTNTAGTSPNDVTPGLYYNSGTPASPNWKRVSTGNSDAWTLDGNSNGAFRLFGTNDNQPLGIETNGTEWVRIGTSGNVAIGTTSITSSAALDVTSTSRGVLLPRVALTATNAAGPVTSPATSLLVYNTATAGTAPNNVTPGFYMWDGSAWQRFDVGNNIGDWKVTGNSNTASPAIPGTYGTSTVGATENMIGTRNAADVVFATNNIEQMRLISGGRAAIGTATGTATAMLSVNTTTNALRDAIAINMSGASSTANGVSITAGNGNSNGINYTNSTSAAGVVFGTGAVLSSTNIVSGYSAYRNTGSLSYGLYGVNGTPSTYATSANTWAAFLQGRVVISSESSPSSAVGTDLEIRNTSIGSNPVNVSLRQTTSNTTSGTVLANINIGDNYTTPVQASISVTRSATSSNATDLPTDFVFSNTPDNSATLTERMRISQNGNIGMGTSTIPNESRLVLGAIDGVNEGGQLQLNAPAPAGPFNVAFYLDNYQNAFRLMTGSNSTSSTVVMSVANTGLVNIPSLSPGLGVYTDASRNLTTTIPTSGQLGYWTRSGTLMWNSNTGDFVGIGTTSPGRTLEVNGDICIPSVSGNKSIYTWANNDANWRIGMSNNPGFTRALATSHVEYLTFASGAGQGFAVGDVVSGLSAFEVGSSGSSYNAYFRGSVGIGTSTPVQNLDINGRVHVGLGVIQRGGTAITGTTDLGLYSRNSGNWMRFVTNAAPIRFFSDDNFGTNYNMTLESNGNLGLGFNLVPLVRLAVNGSGTNVYGTDIWAENNIHIQGNETMVAGGRGRLRVGSAWGYQGLYTDGTSTGANNDLVLGASSGLVRVGPNGGGQNLRVSGLEGTGNRSVFANANGIINASSSINDGGWNMSTNIIFSRDDINNTGTSSGVPAGATFTSLVGSGVDEGFVAYNFGFPIYINGIACTWLAASSNGFIQFNNANLFNPNTFSNNTIPSGSFTYPTLCYYWDDMITTGNGIRAVTLGTAPNRVVVVDFELITFTGSFGINGQVQIHEGSNHINVRYGAVNPYACGQGATIGIQVNSATSLPVSCNAKVLDDNATNTQSISFSPSR